MATLRTTLLPLLALGLLTASCALLARWQGGRELVFSHELHVVEEEIACVSCHEDMSVAEDPGMPSFDSCDVCHFELDEEKPPERRVEAMFVGESYQALRVSALDEEVVFDHLQHVRADIACNACHTGIETDERLADRLAVDMAACMECHADDDVENECSTCHAVIDVDWVPANHAQSWERRHGAVSRFDAPRPADDCGICHEESTCVQCHLEVAPRDHDANFRLRGHGVLSRVDRQSCATCHEPTSCDRCHAEVLPRNHTGLFGGARSTHCISCHFPITSSGCATCHLATPSHTLGPVQPAWHTPDMNCRSCHGTTLPLLHVDNGTNCLVCHP